ncbi:GntR family transcriptional regulator [Amycolatopsis acidiphila]|uniref:FadR/GntR family transcriptional regulator n=1 Tax=Amycolatopsis acidiphila TaxID=715473 RepID=UPI00174EB748|nr:GntR family transcriptional regulator [Amycolatopsis acidiphila]UIJ61135.1 GntR family transcriptional regulator [Amycolatopsis acidiphila]
MPDSVARPSILPPKAGEMLADDIRASIIGDALPAGTRLPSERELVEQHGLSRATVREALRLLDAEGLITIKRGPRGGITVRHPDPTHFSRSLATMVALRGASLGQLFDFRLSIEPDAAAAAATMITDEQRKVLLDSTLPRDAEVPESVDFHVQVSAASGNALYHIVVASLHEVLEQHVTLEALSDDAWEQTRSAHEKIAKAIASGNATKARNAMRWHLERFREDMAELGRLDEWIIPRSAWHRPATHRATALG